MIAYWDWLNLSIAQMFAGKYESTGIVVMFLGLCAIIFHRRLGACMAKFQRKIGFTDGEKFFQKERNCQIGFLILGIAAIVFVGLSLLGYIQMKQ